MDIMTNGMEKKYDMAVVGGGPAGAWTGKTAAELGLNVLIMEEHKEFGSPLQCAEGVSKQGLEFLNIDIDESCIARKIKGSWIISPNGTKIEIPQKKSKVGLVLNRKIFDRFLVEQAVRAGAKVRIRTKAEGLLIENGLVKGVKGISFGEEFEVRADIVIGADGVGSKVGRWASIDTSTKIMPCVQVLLAGIENEINSNYSEFCLGNEIAPGGYAWVFPKGEDLANIGLGFDHKRAEQGLTLFDYLERFIKKRFPDGQIIEIVSGGVPVVPIKEIVADRVMLAGDSARQVNPITGGGIVHAMEAGAMAAEVAARAISRGDVSKNMLMEYQERWHNSKTGKDIQRMYRMSKVIAKLSDKKVDKIACSLKDKNLEGASSIEIANIVIRENPMVFLKLRHLF